MCYLKIMTRILLPVSTHIIVSTPKAPVTKLQPLIKHSILPIIFSGNKNTNDMHGDWYEQSHFEYNCHLVKIFMLSLLSWWAQSLHDMKAIIFIVVHAGQIMPLKNISVGIFYLCKIRHISFSHLPPRNTIYLPKNEWKNIPTFSFFKSWDDTKHDFLK